MHRPEHAELLTASATDLAGRLRRGELTAQALVNAHIHHAETVNQDLNAIVFDRYALARAGAEAADARLAAARAAGTVDSLPPFLGVPCTIKENFEFAGTPQASGLWKRRELVNTTNAPTVQAILDAGFIPLGVTNTSELCMWMESYNDVYGRCNNPYDVRRTVGGSSGGEGAIVGAGASPWGLGADVGGSIRMPAFFNGVFGHKCSPFLISNDGQYPAARGAGHNFLSTGPLCRRAADLQPLLTLLAATGAHLPGHQGLRDPAGVDFARLRVFTVMPERGPRLAADQRDARDRAVRAFVQAGARHREIDLPLMDKGFDIWSSMLAEDGQSFAEMMYGTTNPGRAFAELGKLAIGRSRHTLPLVVLSALEKVPDLLPRRAEKFRRLGNELKKQIDDALGDDGILVELPYPEVAPVHGRALLTMFSWVRCALFNAMQVSSTAVPMGLDAQGIPTGVQLVAKAGNDHLGVAGALLLEKVYGGWVPPWTVAKRG